MIYLLLFEKDVGGGMHRMLLGDRLQSCTLSLCEALRGTEEKNKKTDL